MSRMMSMLKNSDFTEDFGKLIRDQKFQDSTDQEKGLGILRSGSTPPTMEGAASSACSKNGGNGEFLREAELKANAAYADFCSRNTSMNSRLPPPLMSKGDWTFCRRLQGGNENTNMPICSSRTELGGEEDDNIGGKEWKGEGLMGLRRQGTISEITQDDVIHGSTITRHPSCPASGYPFHDETEFQNVDSPVYHASVPAFSSPMSRSSTPDPPLSAQIHRQQNLLAGRGWPACMDERNTLANTSRVVTKGLSGSEDLLASFSGMNLSTNSTDGINHSQLRTQHVTFDHNFENFDQNPCLTGLECEPFYHSCAPSAKGLNISRGNGVEMGLKGSFLVHDQQEFGKPLNCQRGPFIPAPSRVGSPWNSSAKQPISPVANFSLNGYEMNPPSPPMMGSVLENGSFPPFFQGAAPASAFGGGCLEADGLAGCLRTNLMASAAELHALNELRRHETLNASHASFSGSLYHDHPKLNEFASAKFGALSNPGFDKDYGCNNSYLDFLGLQRAYQEALLAHRKLQHLAPCPGKLNFMTHNQCRDHALDLDLSYPRSPLASPLFSNSSIGLGSPMRHRDCDMHFSSSLRKYGVANDIWHSDTAFNLEEGLGLSLLDEFKSNKMRCLELSEIASHVVEFSADQYGSRFIQQKLETATLEEKNMIFNEIMPHALALMTDVFGNYVIQKFLEHGSGAQIRELADKLTGHVLALSLHMYGCRVIQKAIEVVELDQKTSMVKELEGHVMRCVRDQNGNHVIQKCIECVPEDLIQFIVSTFYDHVVTLSTHPYGCRVIQRILEHCQDPKTQQIVMDEILKSVCMLAQDQYGNYVVQHVLAHGKPEERSVIIKEFTGQIVVMSQQKFASNVVEKCLTYGTPKECQTLVDEMLGSTDDNEPLQVMMKDQFANYVVQKVLETCDDQQLELILNRIKVHLNSLKKYTYGKHIVARVEKLVAAGEKRISSILAAQPALMA